MIADDQAVAENMRLHAPLMLALESGIKRHGWTQSDAARQPCVLQPRVSDLTCGKIAPLGRDTLVNLAVAAGP